jgi:hypothetical protein
MIYGIRTARMSGRHWRLRSPTGYSRYLHEINIFKTNILPVVQRNSRRTPFLILGVLLCATLCTLSARIDAASR